MCKILIVLFACAAVQSAMSASGPDSGPDSPFIEEFDNLGQKLDKSQLGTAEWVMRQFQRLNHKVSFDKRNILLLRDQYVDDILGAEVATKQALDIFHRIVSSKVAEENKDEVSFLNKVPLGDDQFGVDKKKVASFFQKFVVQPCKYYVENLGDQVFKPYIEIHKNQPRYARFMIQNMAGRSRDKYLNDAVEYEPFYDGWATYTLCEKVVSDQYLDLRYAEHVASTVA